MTDLKLPSSAIEDSAGVEHRLSWWRHWEVAALVVLVLGIYFTRLAAVPVCGEESRWASAAREMIASGDWVVPRQQGTIFPERPPLGSWAMAAVGLVRGDLDLIAVRLPSALATLALSLLIYVYANRWMSRVGALASAVAYATFGQVMQLGRLGESEAVFTCFAGGALLAWHGIYLGGRQRALAWCAGYGMAALGALVKGPQAPVYFVSVTVIFLLLERNWRWLFCWGHACGATLFAAIVGAWLVPFALANWSSVDDIWAGLSQDRFTTHNLLNHLVSYPLETFGCLLPWSPLLLALLNPAIRRRIWIAHPQMKFLLVALVVTYPSVWLAAGARGRYYMPLYPCVAVLAGLVIEHCTAQLAERREWMFWRHFQRLSAIGAGVGAVGLVVISLISWQPVAAAAQSGLFLAAWIPSALASVGLLVWASHSEWRPRPQIAVLALGGILAFANSGVLVNVKLRGANDIEPSISDIKQRLADGKLVSLGRVYHRFAYSFDEPIPQVDWPLAPADLPADVEYFCFDRRPGDTDQSRSGSDARVPFSTPGTLPFEWEEVAAIPCDPVQRPVHNRTVVIGRRVRAKMIATSAAPIRR
jgi:4-amino-4-deoxy-L-arabinose transferase-like glycosyltransferase